MNFGDKNRHNELISKYQKLIDAFIPESENVYVKLSYETID